jgi:hypothetical protein
MKQSSQANSAFSSRARVLCDTRNFLPRRTPTRYLPSNLPTSDPAVLADLDEQTHYGFWQDATLFCFG